ncbi:MAG: iron ABC transporter permease [Gammaproteobacteria bacterium]|nr:iron ABC transporter permease [Gammaproteobacteria bacterium]
MLIAAAVVLPIAVLFASWLQPAEDVWIHLAETVLSDIVSNSAILVIGVSVGTLVLGTSLAWFTAMCEFPGRRVFEWALMLPLAMPAYVMAFVMVGLFDYSGSAAALLRETTGIVLPSIRSAGGVVTVMVLAFYPYVYMLARAAFQSQGRNLTDSARVLGMSPWGAFYRIALPMSRPALAGGVSLAVMESLADFGAVAVFNYDTFTTAIYKSWLGMFNLQAAAQLASLLLLFVLLMIYGERRLRNRARYVSAGKGNRDLRYRLAGRNAAFVSLYCSIVFVAAFIVPVAQLFSWIMETGLNDLNKRYLDFLGNTLLLGGMAAAAAAIIALMLAYTYRLQPDGLTRVAMRIATMGYALPGSVLAVGIMLVVVRLDQALVTLINVLTGLTVTQVLTGSVVVLVIAYVVRFLAVAFSPIDSAFERIRPSILQAARSLGAGNWQILWRVSLPMLRSGVLTAMLLVFVEVMKEMPATLLLRPFGWDTLATRIFEMTSEGEWERAALPALSLVLAGLIPVALLIRKTEQG